MIAPTLHSGRFVQNIKVNDLLIFQPLLSLIDNYSLTLCHLYGHTASGFFIEKLSFGLIELFSHRSCDCVLVHEQVVPICLVVEVCLQNFFFFAFVVWLRYLSILILQLSHLMPIMIPFSIVEWKERYGDFLGGLFLGRFNVELSPLEIRFIELGESWYCTFGGDKAYKADA